MKSAQGHVHDRISVLGNSGYPVYLVQGHKKTLLVDAGISLLGPRYLASLVEHMGANPHVDYLFLTHSHYDHVGAVQYLKEHIPGMKVGAHPLVAELMSKPPALQLMNRLTANHVSQFHSASADEDLTVRPFAVDVPLKEGDEFDLGGLTCQVYETPGHTRDSLSFYFPQIGALFPGEACGLPEGESKKSVLVSFLSSYDAYLRSLKRIRALSPLIICLAHAWVLDDEDARGFLDRSIASTSQHRRRIERYLEEAGGDIEVAIQTMAHAEYDAKGGIRQERTAYLTNLAAQVRHVASLRV
jgi:glyoxylase-like metal-dependent hydrolase (beta-lactamase superfamily II)